MRIDPAALAAIVAMGAATYLTRTAGYWLARRFTLSGRVLAGLEAVPGAILIALIAPAAFATGVAESAAAAVALLVAVIRWPMLVALVASAAVAAGVRAVI
jgi:uncharacterized membrane protein